MVGVDPDRARSIALVIVKGASSHTHIGDGDSIVIDQNIQSADALAPGSLILVQSTDKTCFDVIALSAQDSVTDHDTAITVRVEGAFPTEWIVIGRVIWIGRRT
jgi:hypothetical protein